MLNKLKKFFMKNESLSLFLMIASLISIPILIIYLLKSITNESFDYNPHKELIFFSMPGCGHCENFKPTWDLLVKNYGNIKDIELIQVISNQKPELVEKFEIQGFPTILFIKDSQKVSEYKGDRSYEDLVKYMKFCMSS